MHAIINSLVGADYSFRREEFNRSFCKSTVHVTYIFLIATTTKEKLANAIARAQEAFAPRTLALAA